MNKNDHIDKLAQAMANLATDYAEASGLDFGDVMNALGRTYVSYGFTVKSKKITNEELSESLVEFISASCGLMVEALKNAKEA